MASIDLRFSQDDDEPQKQSYDLRVQALSAVDMPTEVFVINRGVAPITDLNGDTVDIYTSVADPLDLEEYPAGVPSDPKIPFYRLDDITLRFRAYSELVQVKEYIRSDIQGLVNALNSALSEPIDEDVTIS